MTIGNINIDLSENTLVLTFDYVALEKNYAIQCYIEGDVVYYIKAYVDGNHEFLGTKRLPAEIKELVPSKEKVEKMFIKDNGSLPKKLNLFLIENMLGVKPEFISSLKEEFEKFEHRDSEILICCRVCDEMKDIDYVPEEFRDKYFNDYPWLQIGIRCWKNNTAKDVLFTTITTKEYIKSAVLDHKTTPDKEWIKWFINEYGEMIWPDEKGHDKYIKKIMKDNKKHYAPIYCSWDPDFEWKNGRIVEGPDIRTEEGRIKWDTIWNGLKKILQAKKD